MKSALLIFIFKLGFGEFGASKNTRKNLEKSPKIPKQVGIEIQTRTR